MISELGERNFALSPLSNFGEGYFSLSSATANNRCGHPLVTTSVKTGAAGVIDQGCES